MDDPLEKPMVVNDDFAFWRFSLHIYSGAGVPEACLRLQDEHDVDVNVMLYLLFLARCGRRIVPTDIDRIEATVGDWREHVVRPLREVRRHLKLPRAAFDAGLTNALRSEVKRLELESERLQQFVLAHRAAPETLGEPFQNTATCVRHNLNAYAERQGGFPAEPVAAILRRFDAL